MRTRRSRSAVAPTAARLVSGRCLLLHAMAATNVVTTDVIVVRQLALHVSDTIRRVYTPPNTHAKQFRRPMQAAQEDHTSPRRQRLSQGNARAAAGTVPHKTSCAAARRTSPAMSVPRNRRTRPIRSRSQPQRRAVVHSHHPVLRTLGLETGIQVKRT